MHAGNPVDWYPWGEEALQKAKEENKLLVISIGYAACHWCHVMEHESFEDNEVAEAMNANYVSIKVDREERPDIDDIYMTACQIINNTGGWPLNAIALPDGRPVFAGTYYPKDSWIKILNEVNRVFKEDPDKLENIASQVKEGLNAKPAFDIPNAESNFESHTLNEVWKQWKTDIDLEWGGFHRMQNKFPLPVGLNFLMEYYYHSKDEEVQRHLLLTLDKMALGGIFDQIGGGFARYSVDRTWKVPHFEKMLYDNGQLMELYAKAYALTGDLLYKSVVEKTFEWLEREMLSPQGVYYSALDADSEGEEGKFYSWSPEEFEILLEGDAEILKAYYNVTDAGNFEHGRSVLFRKWRDEEIAETHGIDIDELRSKVNKANETLFSFRAKRVPPPLDDKIITGWNALAIKGLVAAYRYNGDEQYLKRAIAIGDFIMSELWDGKTLQRIHSSSHSIPAFLEDYAHSISAFIDLYQVNFDDSWIDHAETLINKVLTYFVDQESGFFYFTDSTSSDLIARRMEIQDNVIPASNPVMAENLFILAHLNGNDEYRNKSKEMLQKVSSKLVAGGVYMAKWSSLLSKFLNPITETAIVGPEHLDILSQMNRVYTPNVIFLGAEVESDHVLLEGKFKAGETLIYNCRNKTCKSPVGEAEVALEEIREFYSS